MKKRNLILCFVFTFITLGIYTLYWQASLQNAYKDKCGEGFGGGLTVLFSILCYIYFIYWNYEAGKRSVMSGITQTDNSILYLVLSIMGLPLVNMFIMQADINRYLDTMPDNFI